MPKKVNIAVQRAKEIAQKKHQAKLVSMGQKPELEKEKEIPYDASGDLIKFAGWKFDAIIDNHKLRKCMDILHRDGSIFHAAKNFAFRNAFVIEPRYLGPAAYEDYEMRKRRYVPCMMVFSVYVTIMALQLADMEQIFEKAKEDLKTPMKKAALEYFEDLWTTAVKWFNNDIKKLNLEIVNEVATIEELAENTKQIYAEQMKTCKDEKQKRFIETMAVSLQAKKLHLITKAFENCFKRWLNTYELQRCKAQSMAHLIGSLFEMHEISIDLERIKHTTSTTMTEQLAGTLYFKYECKRTHPMTDSVFMTFSKENIEMSMLELQQEYETVEPLMLKALEEKGALNQPPQPHPFPKDLVEEPLPAVDLTYYDDDGLHPDHGSVSLSASELPPSKTEQVKSI